MRILAALLALCMTTSIARAAPMDPASRAQARDHYKKGSLAYDLGHYDVAVKEYEAAYEISSDPALLFNLGQAHKLAKHNPDALHFYKMYLVKVPNAPNRSDVENKIAALETAIADDNRAHAAPPVAPVDKTSHETPTEPAVVVPEPAVVVPEPAVVTSPADHPHKRTLEIAGLAAGIAGLGLVAGGIATAVLSKRASNEIASANNDHGVYVPSTYSTFTTDRLVSGVLLGVGAVALISGVTLGVIGHRRGHASTMAWQVAPQLSPTQAGVAAALRF